MRKLKFPVLVVIAIVVYACSHTVNDIGKIKAGQFYRAKYNKGFVFLRFFSKDKKAAGELIMADKAVTEVREIELILGEKDKTFELNSTDKLENINWRGTCEIGDSAFSLDVQEPFSAHLEFSFWEVLSFKGIENRYRDSITRETERVEISYGSAEGYYASKPVKNISAATYPQIVTDVISDLTDHIDARMLDLRMDVYRAKNDSQAKRPLILLIHGGAFIVGDKRDDLQVQLGHYFACRGYVVASINYRLGYFFIPGVYKNLERCMYKAIQDTRAALRYLSAHKDKYHIDPNWVFLAGNSAGGFTALHTAFMGSEEIWESTRSDFFGVFSDLGCLDCSTNNDEGKYKLRGVVNLWGALADTTLMDTDEKIPLLLIHGDADQIVPEGFEYPFRNVDPSTSAFFTNKVAGSEFIAQRAANKKIPVHFIRIKKQGHEPQCDKNGRYNGNLRLIEDSMNLFFYRILGGKEVTLKNTIKGQPNELPVFTAECSKEMNVYWDVRGGMIADVSDNGHKAMVVWLGKNKKRSVMVRAVSPQGLVLKTKMLIKD